MADKISIEKRKRNMQHIKGKDTAIEIAVRKYLFKRGFRFRKNVRSLPGTPDVVLPKYKTVIFVHGCFWHCHPNCKEAHVPKTRPEYWIPKLEKNKANDELHFQQLAAAGWSVIIIWECQLENNFDLTMLRVENELLENYIQTENK